MDNKEIILQTLQHIENRGYVNVKDSFWSNDLKINNILQDEIKSLLLKGKMVSIKMGEPYTFEITDPIGVSILKNPSKLKEDGTLRKSIKSRLIKIKDKYWLLILLLTYLLGIFSPILTEIIKVQLPEEWFKRSEKINKKNILDSNNMIIHSKDSVNIDSVNIK